ncbi:hypothetical protein AB205_0150880 [Aquarana catesbeiana]|uniref:Uncharacterized protein n=1 Tax=Aquarana catesbeiana TaxID=8400 RepID=A0A2G9RAP9_AQUCT|nr:hypothetical protein AB205_0150880 [Aquarana catesbeiana]
MSIFVKYPLILVWFFAGMKYCAYSSITGYFLLYNILYLLSVLVGKSERRCSELKQ